MKDKKIKQLKEKIGLVSKKFDMYLFGSHASGNAKEWSDIDIAIISPEFTNLWEDRKKIESVASKIDDSFEIHIFNTLDFANKYDPLVTEIKKYGVLL